VNIMEKQAKIGDPSQWEPTYAVGDLVKEISSNEHAKITQLPGDASTLIPNAYRGIYLNSDDEGLFFEHELEPVGPTNPDSVGHVRNHPDDAPEQLYPIDKLGSPLFNLSFDARTGATVLTQGSGVGGVERVVISRETFEDRKPFEGEVDFIVRQARKFSINASAHRMAFVHHQDNGQTVTEAQAEARVGCGKAQEYELDPVEVRPFKVGDRVKVTSYAGATAPGTIVGQTGVLQPNWGGSPYPFYILLDDGGGEHLVLEEEIELA
jgi:hypothetical protein